MAKLSCKQAFWAQRRAEEMVFSGEITPDLTAPGVTPDLTAHLKSLLQPYIEAPKKL